MTVFAPLLSPVLGSIFEKFGGTPPEVFRASVEAAAIGDSLIANSYGTGSSARLDYRGWMHHANQMLGAPMRFRIAAMQGVSGETSAQILARISGITSLSPKPKICFVSAGNNDVNTGVSTATTIANITAIIAALNSAGITAVMGPVFARSTSTSAQITATQTINNAIELLASPRKMIWCDWSNLIDGSGQTLANILFDGTHPGTVGARAMAVATAAALAPRLSGEFPLATTADPGLMTNALLTGTGGTANQGFTGQNATGYISYRVGASTGGTQTLSKVTRADGNGSWVQMAFSGITYVGQYTAGITSPALTYAAAGLAEGDWYESVFEAEVDAGATNFEGVGLQVLDNNGSATVQTNWTSFVGTGAAHVSDWSSMTRLVVRTAPLQLRADAGADSLQLRLLAKGDGGGPGGITAIVRVGRATIRKLPV